MEWVSTEKILRCFDGPKDYRRFVESSNKKLMDPFRRAVGGTVLGSETFVKWVQSLTSHRSAEDEREVLGLAPLRRHVKGPSPEVIREAVDELFSDWSDCQRRRMWVYLLQQCPWMKGTEIARLADRTPGAVSHAVKTFQDRIRADWRLQAQVEGLIRQWMTPLPLR